MFADDQIRRDRRSGTNRGAIFHQRWFYFPIPFGLELAFRIGGTRISVIDEGYAVAHENIVFNGHSFANKAMARDLAILADSGVLLNLYERAYFGVVPHFAAIEIDESGELHIFSQLHIGSDAVVFVHSETTLPRPFKDWSAASSILTTRKPAAPSFIGVRSFSMQSMKHSGSTFSASICSIFLTQTSPDLSL